MYKKLTITGLLITILSLAMITPVFADGNSSEVTADGTTIIDPANEGDSTGTITRPDENGSKICEDDMPECQPVESTLPEEKPVIVPEGEHLSAEEGGDLASDIVNTTNSLLDQLNFEQNWPMYLSFGSIILAVIFFIALNIVDRKRRAA